MDVTPLISRNNMVIQDYKNGRFVISGQTYAHPVLVFPLQVLPWEIKDASFLNISDFNNIFNSKSELLLIGASGNFSIYSNKLKFELKAKNLQFEIMDTGAACRTYNVLMAEGRRVAAALMLT